MSTSQNLEQLSRKEAATSKTTKAAGNLIFALVDSLQVCDIKTVLL